jgi:hypothetical protein
VLCKYLDDVNVVKTCYEYFKSIKDMDGFNSLEIPQTEHQQNLKELSITPIEQWLKDFTIENYKENEVELLGTTTLKSFKLWCEKNNVDYQIDALKLGVRISNLRINGISKGADTYKGKTKIYNIPKLKEHFKIGCLIDIKDKTKKEDDDDTDCDIEIEEVESNETKRLREKYNK